MNSCEYKCELDETPITNPLIYVDAKTCGQSKTILYCIHICLCVAMIYPYLRIFRIGSLEEYLDISEELFE
jgi:hypothetical protein